LCDDVGFGSGGSVVNCTCTVEVDFDVFSNCWAIGQDSSTQRTNRSEVPAECLAIPYRCYDLRVESAGRPTGQPRRLVSEQDLGRLHHQEGRVTYTAAAVEHVIRSDAPALGQDKNATASATRRTQSAAISAPSFRSV
jgi:hypothetical protein